MLLQNYSTGESAPPNHLHLSPPLATSWIHPCHKVYNYVTMFLFKLCRKESLLITKASMVRACNLAFFYVSVVVLNFVSFSTYAGAGNTLTSRRVFTVIALLTFARFYLVIFPVYFLLSMTEMKVAVQRIQVQCYFVCLLFDCTVTETTITTRTW